MSASVSRCLGYVDAAAGSETDLLLSEYVDGELNAADTAMVVAHVAICPACASELAFLKATNFVMTRRTPDVFPPPALFDRIAQMTYARPTWQQRLSRFLSPTPVRVGLGAALAAGILTAVVLPQATRQANSPITSGNGPTNRLPSASTRLATTGGHKSGPTTATKPTVVVRRASALASVVKSATPDSSAASTKDAVASALRTRLAQAQAHDARLALLTALTPRAAVSPTKGVTPSATSPTNAGRKSVAIKPTLTQIASLGGRHLPSNLSYRGISPVEARTASAGMMPGRPNTHVDFGSGHLASLTRPHAEVPVEAPSVGAGDLHGSANTTIAAVTNVHPEIVSPGASDVLPVPRSFHLKLAGTWQGGSHTVPGNLTAVKMNSNEVPDNRSRQPSLPVTETTITQ